MSTAIAFRERFDRVVRRAGDAGTVTVRRAHTLKIPATGVAPTVLVDGAHLAGATAVSLKATSMTGKLPAGLRLTIGATQHEVQADARVVANKLASVAISPALVANVADEAAVTVETSRDYTFPRMQSRRVERAADGSLVRLSSTDLLLSALGSGTDPRSEDRLVVSGVPEEIGNVVALGPTDAAIGWKVVRS